jgi:hypothetical protein
MTQTAQGRATLANLLFDIAHGRVPPAVVDEFLNAAVHWNPTSDDPPEHILKGVQAEPARLVCCGPRVPPSAGCSRVMHVRDLLRNNIEKSKLGFLIWPTPTREQMDLLVTRGPRAAKGYMRTHRAYAWVTPTAELERALKAHESSAEPASAARRLLGLLHFQEDEFLVEIDYPSPTSEGAYLVLPTFVEGCPSLVFRGSSHEDGWGRAVDLETLNDGLPEAIHLPIAFTDAFTIKSLGKLTPMRRPFDWEAFLATLPNPWSGNSLEVVMAYVQENS